MRRALVSSSILIAVFVGCAEPLDTTRKIAERGTLGEEIYRVLHRDLEREAPERAFGLEAERRPFIAAIDHMMPEPELARTQELLVSLLPLYDDETLPKQTRTVSGILTRLRADPAATAGLAALQNRVGYVDLARQEALVRRIAAYPRFREMSRRMLGFALAHDGRNETGAADPEESDLLIRMLRYGSERAAELEVTGEPDPTLELIAGLLLKEDPRLATNTMSDPPQIVARDPRGMALVEPPAINTLALFQDVSPADGLADVDESGRFVAPGGMPVDLPPFSAVLGNRDEAQRAMSTQGLVYRYLELDQTLLATALRDGRAMIERGAVPKMRRVGESLLGPRTEAEVYDATTSPLVDLGHALLHGIAPEDAVPLVSIVRKLLASHEGALSYVLEQLERQADLAAADPASLKPGNTMLTDLLSLVRRLLEQPGLVESLLTLIEEDPDILLFPSASAELMSYRRLPITEEDFDQGQVFVTPVDRSQPDTRENQSFHQRVLHLIYDTRGVRYRPELLGVPLGFVFEIPDLGEFYMLSLIGQAEVPSLVSTLTGLSTHPTPTELARFINEDQLFGNAVGNEGIEVRHNDGDVLFAIAASDMGQALAPLVELFWSRGQMDLLFDIFELLHLHYATQAGGDFQDVSRQSPRYSKLSGVRDLEPLLISIYREVELLESTGNLLRETRGLTATGGAAARDVLLRALRRFIAKDPALTTRSGATDVVVDGRRVSPLSPFELVWWAVERMDQVVQRSPSTKLAADELGDMLHEIYLETEGTGTGRRLRNRRAVVMADYLLAFTEERLTVHQNRGGLERWWKEELVSEMEDAVSSPALPLLLDFSHELEADAELESMMLELRDQMFSDTDGFPEVLAITGDLLGAAKDASLCAPMLRFMGREMHPDKGLALEMIDFVNRALDFDPDQQLLELARRGLEPAEPDGIYLYGLGRAIQETNRARPGAGTLLSTEDVRLILDTVTGYMVDDEHGLEKFYQLVRNRNAAHEGATE